MVPNRATHHIYDPMLILQKIIICGYIPLVIGLWADIFITYIALNPISTFLRQFYPGDLANFAGSIIFFFIVSTKLLHCRDGAGFCSSWSISSLATVSDVIFLPLPLLSLTFLALFYCDKFMSVSFNEAFGLSWEISLENLPKVYSRGNSYCKCSRNYSNEATKNEEECRQVFIVWLVKFGNKYFLCCYKKGKNV